MRQSCFSPRPAALLLAAAAALPLTLSAQVRISQVYGAGGNAGATLNSDYVELFNAGSSPAALAGYSIQYAATTGTNWSRVNLNSGSIPAGGYFLVRITAAGANGAAISPDLEAAGSIAMAAGAGKVALLNNQTTITTGTACPSGAALVDFVPYGSGTNCPNPTANLSAILAAFRASGGCTDTDNSTTDFSNATPAPRNAASALNPCGGGGGPTPLSATGAASPNSVQTGNTSLLTVTVTPGASPASTGITVSANLATAGGANPQAFFDNGTNGDVTAGDNVFSFALTVPGGTAPGAKTLAFSATDAQARTANGTIGLTVTAPALVSNINQSQGAGLATPLAGFTVRTSGIVTALRGDSFYLQNSDATTDADPNTSEAILVFAGTGNVPACAVIGNQIDITGVATEFTVPITATGYRPPVGSASLTELTSPSACTVLSAGNPLPAAVVLNSVNVNPAALTAADRWTQLEKFENMRVTALNLSTTENPSGTRVFAHFADVAVPYREAGIQATKYPSGATVPAFDNNPELFRIDGDGLNGAAAAFDLTAGSTIASVTGVLNYTGDDGFFAIRTNAAGVGAVTNSNLAAAPVLSPLATDLTVATMNAENFTGADPVALAKVSLTIRTILKNPDIIGFEEMGSQTALDALAARIVADGGPAYTAAIFGAGTQRVAFLYRTVKLQGVSVFEAPGAAAATYINPVNGATEPTFDRVPLILTATAKVPGSDSGVPVTVVVNHAKSLIDVDNSNETNPSDAGRRNQAKRHAGGRETGIILQSLNTAGVNLISVGDYNAFQFSDGYVDVMACIRGAAVGAQVFNPAASSAQPCLVYPAANQLTNLTDLNPAARYSLSFSGNRQSLDHILLNANALARKSLEATAYVNSDYPRNGAISNDSSRPERYADHNPHLVYLSLPMEVTSTTQVAATVPQFNRQTGRFQSLLTVTNNGAGAIGTPVHLFFHNLPAGIAVANATGTLNGVPYITVNAVVGGGQTSGPVAVQFTRTGTTAAITYTTRVYSVTF
ncbi:MAG: lamin tail domain-containing protein [Bryobacterales bacterium]|nr:lamin tail domain-containing protein [Bryobacterales bacterium]